MPEGSAYVEEGTVDFKMTDNGWVKDDVSITRFGYCANQPLAQLAQCYKTIGWDKDNSSDGKNEIKFDGSI